MNHTRRQTPRRLRRSLLSAALASCLLVGVPVALAQSTGATLRGQAGADAKVTATNTATGFTRTVAAGGNGGYTLPGLPPGTYHVSVESGGQTTSRDITLRVGETVTLNADEVTGDAGGANELDTVKVVGAVLRETKTSEVATYVSPRQMEALPQASRNFLAFADTVPGMVFETGIDGSTKLRGGAQNSNGINVFIDGVGQKNYVLKGGISGQDSSSGNPFPQLAIGEYKVITSNYKAEFDQISSAAVSAVTRSGTNEFEGQFFWDYTTDKMRSRTFREDRQGSRIPSSEQQYGAAFGGPILQDRLFFFLTYEAKEIDRPREIRLGDNAFNPALLTPELASYLGASDAPFDQKIFHVDGLLINPQHLLILGMTVLLVVALYTFLFKTGLGRMMRATAQDRDTARLLGVKVGGIGMITFVMSLAIGGMAGVLVAPLFLVDLNVGFTAGLKAFIATIIGGWGSIPGALAGGIIVGLVEIFATHMFSAAFKDPIAFAVLMIFLIVRPSGIFAERVGEKA